jgi:hypothetical protein
MGYYNKHIIILGSARSGTSWLAETIAKQHRYRLLFEPDHEFQTKKGKLICDKWIENKEQAGKGHRYLKKVFANRVDNDWIAQNSNRKWKRHLWPVIPKKIVVKFVRANLMGAYLNKTFKIPVLHIIRNPYDVIASQNRVKFPWLYDLKHFQEQPRLVQLIQEHFGFNIRETHSFNALEKLALRWCIENVIPLEVIKYTSPSYRVVTHEDLRADIKLYREVCSQFNLTPISNLEEMYSAPSSKTHPKSDVRNPHLNKNKLPIEEIKKVDAILTIFKVENNFKKPDHT